MKNVSHLLLAALLSSLLASCATSTMDSIPTVAELNAYEKVVRAKYQSLYDDLDKRRASGAISKAQYDEDKQRLDAKVAAAVNDAAWNKHFLAESERKSDGVPTPDRPVALAAGQVGGMLNGSVGSGGMGSFYRPSFMNYGAVAGIGGSAGMSGSMRSANDQIGKGQSIRNDAISAGGSYISSPPPGSVYDNDPER